MKGSTLILIVAVAAALASCAAPNRSENTASHSNHNVAKDPPVDHSKMDHGSMDHSTMKSSPNAADADYDLQFLDTMIAHHQAAIDMAKLVDGRSEHAELKKLAANIVAMQQKEITAMKTWREKWFIGKPEAINMEMAGMKDSMAGMDMKKLEGATGNAFDVEFAKQMIPHHEGAVIMAKDALQRSKKDEIKTLSNEIVREQNAEIEMMKAWGKE